MDETDSKNLERAMVELKRMGAELVDGFKNKSIEVLLDEEIVEKRKTFLELVSAVCATEEPAASKTAIDLGFPIRAISAFRKNRTRDRSEREALDRFISEGILFFKQIAADHPHVQQRALLWAGDLARYGVKLCNRDPQEAIAAYESVLRLDLTNSTAFSKLSVVYEERNPERALYLLLRSMAGKETISTDSLAAFKPGPSHVKDVYTLAFASFETEKELFGEVLTEFKESLADEMRKPNGRLVQMLQLSSLIAIILSGGDQPNRLKALISTISDFFNRHVAELTARLDKTEALISRRGHVQATRPSPDALKSIEAKDHSSFYADVLLPVLALILSLNEWTGFVAKMDALNSTVAWRMECAKTSPPLLNRFAHVFIPRVQRAPVDRWPSACLWTIRGPSDVREEWGFGTTVDCLKRSLHSLEHPLLVEGDRFRCDLSTSKRNRRKKKRSEVVLPNVLLVTPKSFELHWKEILAVVDAKPALFLVLTERTFESLKGRAPFFAEAKRCLEHVDRLRNAQRCFLMADEFEGRARKPKSLSEISARFPSDGVALIAEEAEDRRAAKRNGVLVMNGEELFRRFGPSGA
ncbi:hypothetical protein M3Y99_00345100 [Aphelenchoides fujianensis]|nr:hypothetical protein M3Y99_00345100 [Aphelenchoides fujianensis]